jgi:hypothetical protein
MLQTVSRLLPELPLLLMTAVATHLVMSFAQTLMHYKLESHVDDCASPRKPGSALAALANSVWVRSSDTCCPAIRVSRRRTRW